MHKRINAINLVSGLAQIFNNKKFNITTDVNTPLSEITKEFNVYSDYVLSTDSNITNVEDYVKAVNKLKETEFTEAVEDKIDSNLVLAAAGISNNISQQLMFAKTVIVPSIDQLINAASKVFSLSKIFSKEFEIKVIPDYEVFLDKMFNKMIESSLELPRLDIESINFYPCETIDSLKEKLVTGNVGFDKLVKDTFNQDNDSLLLEIWNKYFCVNNHAQISDIFTLDTNPIEVLYTYLLSLHVAQSVPQDLTSVDLVTYNGRLATVRDMCINGLKQHLARRSSRVTSGKLIGKKQSNVLHVYGEVYDKWIANGGNINVLLGVLVSNKEIYFTDEIAKNSEALLAEYLQAEKLYNGNSNYRNIAYVKEALKSEFFQQLANVPLDSEERNNLYFDVDTISNKFIERIDHFNADIIDKDKCIEIITDIVCEVRFPYTSGKLILSLINDVSKVYKDLDVDSVVNIATIMYITEWLLNQTKITKAN